MSEKKIINIGSGELAGDGESLRVAFDKINHNFNDLYAGSGTTLDSDTAPSLGGNLDLSGNDITGIGNLNITGNITATGSISASLDYSNLTNTPTTLAGYGITDAYTQAQVDSAIANATSSSDIQSGSTQSIDVVAADSTILVDSINGTLNATTLTGALPAIDGSALTGVTTSFSNITSTPTTLAGYGITDALSSSVSAADITGYGVFTGTEEAFATLTGATGTVAHDCDNGHIFYHTTPAADWTANFTNLGLAAEHATTLSIVISQGATAYIPSAVEIGGAAQTILWQGGSAPSGTANGTDVVAFSILNDGGTYIVTGQLVGFS